MTAVGFRWVAKGADLAESTTAPDFFGAWKFFLILLIRLIRPQTEPCTAGRPNLKSEFFCFFLFSHCPMARRWPVRLAPPMHPFFIPVI
jgi:hypothetical protein